MRKNKNLKILISFLSLFLIGLVGSVSADAGDFDGCGMTGMMYGNFGYGGMIFAWIFSLLILIALILLIIWLIKQIQKK